MADFDGKARILCVLGTRPEALKLAPVIAALDRTPGLRTIVCVTGQHRELVGNILPLFGITPDLDLGLMGPKQALADLTARLLCGLDAVIGRVDPHLVLVQGDTTTAMAAGLAAFYRQKRVAHVEAGLRTGDLSCPWPEEANRRIIGMLAALHFAPTDRARRNLLAEGIAPQRVHVTGNTGIDSLLSVLESLRNAAPLIARLHAALPFLESDAGPPLRRLVLVTSHRRESFGAGLEEVCRALLRLSERDDLTIAFPVHLNPDIREPVRRRLGGRRNIHLLDPLDYRSFVYCLSRSWLILTDSGGIQEEASVLGKPVLVLRRLSERVEGLADGGARLVGTDSRRIVAEVDRLCADAAAYRRMSRTSAAYGDGRASARICDVLARDLAACRI